MDWLRVPSGRQDRGRFGMVPGEKELNLQIKIIAFIVIALTPAFAQYDLLLKGGHVIDPRNNIDGVRDVAIQAGKIAEVSGAIDPSRARKTINAVGLYVTPGLVDIHTHLFHTTGVRDAWAGDN